MQFNATDAYFWQLSGEIVAKLSKSSFERANWHFLTGLGNYFKNVAELWDEREKNRQETNQKAI